MKEFYISKNDERRRLDKFVAGVLRNAPGSFIYKMLRKKNIVLNDSKASGKELLSEGDNVKFYLSDDTFTKFSSTDDEINDDRYVMPPVVYEDDDILIVDKPSGMLSQRSKPGDVSLNEICRSYVRKSSAFGCEDKDSFVPSVCNRLDRNTSGLVIFAKTYRGARCIGDAIRSHSLQKFYKCIVKGTLTENLHLTGSLVKDEETNKVVINDDNTGAAVETVVTPVRRANGLTLTQILLITGKTHQIRAHMASVGHPLIGDNKYGDRTLNEIYRKKFGIDSQMLVCYKLVFPPEFGLENLSGKTIETAVPSEFGKVM